MHICLESQRSSLISNGRHRKPKFLWTQLKDPQSKRGGSAEFVNMAAEYAKFETRMKCLLLAPAES